jgi:hypothetical protein
MGDTVSHREGDTLSGWKEIATYLGKSVRSAQRWEAELGLPVRRIQTADGGQIVYGSRQEIDAWRDAARPSARSSPQDASDPLDGTEAPQAEPLPAPQSDPLTEPLSESTPAPASAPAEAPVSVPAASTRTVTRPAWWWGLALLCVGLVAGSLAGMWIGVNAIPALGSPVEFVVEGRHVRGLTESGREVWSHDLGRAGARPNNVAQSVADEGDIDGDGTFEVAISVAYASPHGVPDVQSDAVLLFNRDGRLRWQVQPDSIRLQMGETFAGPWLLNDVVFAEASPGRVWLAYSHHTSGPSFVLEVAADGSSFIRFVQSGRVASLAHWRTPTTEYLAAGGIVTPERLPSVALVPLDGSRTRWPADDQPVACAGCPTGQPARLLLFPSSEVARTLGNPFGYVFRMRQTDGRLRFEADDGARPAVLAWFNPDLSVSGLMHTARYWAAHAALERERRIDHTATDCPERTQPSIFRLWSPETGWRDVPVTPSRMP